MGCIYLQIPNLYLKFFAETIIINTSKSSLEATARGIGFVMNSEKTKFMCFKQVDIITTFNYLTLKIVLYMDANKTAGEEARRQLHENATLT